MMEDFCVLVEFPNDNHKVAVGHASWIQMVGDYLSNGTTRINAEQIIDRIITTGEEIKIDWPKCDILPPPRMIPSGKEIEWLEEVCEVKGHGGECIINVSSCSLYVLIDKYSYLMCYRLGQDV